MTDQESPSDFAKRFMEFNQNSPTPFHVCETIVQKLVDHGFVGILECDMWKDLLKPGGKYFFTRNTSTLVAFVIGEKYKPGNAFKLIGAHTDSPVLKLKPISTLINKEGYIQLAVQGYGGGLWHTWLDRDLGIAGRVILKKAAADGGFEERLVHICKPILRVPSNCPHLQTPSELSALVLDIETTLIPVLGMTQEKLEGVLPHITMPKCHGHGLENRHPVELLNAIAQNLEVDVNDIIDTDLSLIDTQPPSFSGVNSEFVVGSRFDNLAHCFTSTEALLGYAESGKLQEDETVSMIVVFDNEEVGSNTSRGAASPLLRDAIERIDFAFQSAPPSLETFRATLDRSLLLSADATNVYHPNYPQKYDVHHKPLLNHGTVLNTDKNQNTSTTGLTGFYLREIARRTKTPIQEFTARQDLPSGTTIGPIISTRAGLSTVDIGIGVMSMHSIRETLGVADLKNNYLLLKGFFEHYTDISSSLRAVHASAREKSWSDFTKVDG